MRAHRDILKLNAAVSRTPHVFFFPVPPAPFAFGISSSLLI